jgi:hypothetical protein
MNTNSRTSRRLAAGYLTAALVAGLAAATPAAGTSHSANDSEGSFNPASLPRTADAVDGWYAQRQAQQNFATKTGLPSTPDAVDGWYTQRRTQQGLRRWSPDQVDPPLTTGSRQDYTSWLTNPLTAPWAETTETPTADPPTNWRRLMNEVPQTPPPLRRPAPGQLPIDAEHRTCFRMTCGDSRRTTDEQVDFIRKDQDRIREAFERGVGPGQNLHSPEGQK